MFLCVNCPIYIFFASLSGMNKKIMNMLPLKSNMHVIIWDSINHLAPVKGKEMNPRKSLAPTLLPFFQSQHFVLTGDSSSHPSSRHHPTIYPSYLKKKVSTAEFRLSPWNINLNLISDAFISNSHDLPHGMSLFKTAHLCSVCMHVYFRRNRGERT